MPRSREIRTTKDLRELLPHNDPAFPVELYVQSMDDYVTGEVPWHWHDEAQLDFVLEGRARYVVGDKTFLLEQGDGVFINCGALHAARPVQTDDSPCRMGSIVFSVELVSGAPHSVFERRYVQPLVKCGHADGVLLTSGIPWQADVLCDIIKIHQAFETRAFGFEMEVRENLCIAWRRIVTGMRPHLDIGIQHEDHGRVKKMLSFIHENYGNNIQLADIAAQANISIRECNRSFKNHLSMTPFAYLLSYRVRAAAELLGETDRSITDICCSVGFNGPSYFGKVFRSIVGCSPREYRLHEKKENNSA